MFTPTQYFSLITWSHLAAKASGKFAYREVRAALSRKGEWPLRDYDSLCRIQHVPPGFRHPKSSKY